MRSPKLGWRYFFCEDCKTHWRETCRDCETPSSSSCPSYLCIYDHGQTIPYRGIPDPSLKGDGFGNLGPSESLTEILHGEPED